MTQQTFSIVNLFIYKSMTYIRNIQFQWCAIPFWLTQR